MFTYYIGKRRKGQLGMTRTEAENARISKCSILQQWLLLLFLIK